MKKWISSAIIYQINLRSLAAREPRNAIEAAREKATELSPLAYVTKNLRVLKSLGVNVLYLMPPYEMGVRNRKGIGSPYAIHDFRSVDPEYGTMTEMKSFLQKAHALRLKVILDITPNHTGVDHIWTTSHPDYYVKRDNGEIFYDCDWSDTAKLDYTQPALRTEMISVYDFWLGVLGPDKQGRPQGVDGFRLDMAHFINDHTFWNEAIPMLQGRHSERELLFLAECYGTQNNLNLFSRGINAAYDDDFYKVCQYLYALDEEEQTVIAPSPDALSNADFSDKYEAFKSRGIAGAFETALLNYEKALPPGPSGPFLARYTDNHDEGRGTYRFGDGAVRAVSQLAFMSSHCLPFLLTGQEFGVLNRPPIHSRCGVCDKGRRIVRGQDIRKEEGVEFEGNIFARGRNARLEWYHFYQDLIRLRLNNREFTQGQLQLMDAGEACEPGQRTVVSFERRLWRSVLRCAINMGPMPRELHKASLFQGERIFGEITDRGIAPFSSIVVRSPA